MTLKIHQNVKKEPFKIILDEEFLRKELCSTVAGLKKLDNVPLANRIRKQIVKPILPSEARNKKTLPPLLEVVDLAMELQHNMFEISSNTISAYQLQLLLIILESFVAILFNCYYILSIFYNPSHFRLPPYEAGLFLAYQLLQPIGNLLAITITCMITINAAKKTQQIVNRLIYLAKDEKLQQRLAQFSMQIQTTMPAFSVLGLFNIDGTLLFSIAASTTTYLVILFQYSDK
ncbi:unnamed protein product [Hermetia illucens]|uniref:Gustatory receptor n=2 Tax=Hermetia illucens TaxID=343691 RepID=A0A7R8YLG7_HERIL|nr:putative gustatory receptor 28b isoform X2 [Hermetia illucens]CAD7077520.1 unnamed protein product [Hermetia illucens]